MSILSTYLRSLESRNYSPCHLDKNYIGQGFLRLPKRILFQFTPAERFIIFTTVQRSCIIGWLFNIWALGVCQDKFQCEFMIAACKLGTLCKGNISHKEDMHLRFLENHRNLKKTLMYFYYKFILLQKILYILIKNIKFIFPWFM